MFKSFFEKHPEVVLAGLAILFLVTVVGSFVLGITRLIADLNSALGIGDNSAGAASTFDLKGAKELNLKGLNN